MEYRKIMKNPIDYIETRPLDSNILEWHFVLTGTAAVLRRPTIFGPRRAPEATASSQADEGALRGP